MRSATTICLILFLFAANLSAQKGDRVDTEDARSRTDALLPITIGHDNGWTPGSCLTTSTFAVVDSAESVVIFPRPFLPGSSPVPIPTDGGDVVQLLMIDDTTLAVIAQFAIRMIDVTNPSLPTVLSTEQIDYISGAAISPDGLFLVTDNHLTSIGTVLWFTWSRDSALTLRSSASSVSGFQTVMIANGFLVAVGKSIDSQHLLIFETRAGYQLGFIETRGFPFFFLKSIASIDNRIVVTGVAPNMIGTLELGPTGSVIGEWYEVDPATESIIVTSAGSKLLSRLTRYATPVPALDALFLSIGSIETDGSIRWQDSMLISHGRENNRLVQPLYQNDSTIALLVRRRLYEARIADSRIASVTYQQTGEECIDLDISGDRLIAATNHGLVHYRIDSMGSLSGSITLPFDHDHVVYLDNDRVIAYDTAAVLFAIDGSGAVTLLDSEPIESRGLARKAKKHGELIAIPLFEKGLLVLSARGDSLSTIYRDTLSCNDVCWNGDTLLSVGEERAVNQYAVAEDGTIGPIGRLTLPRSDNISVELVHDRLFVSDVTGTEEFTVDGSNLLLVRSWTDAKSHIEWGRTYTVVRGVGAIGVYDWPTGGFIGNVSHEGDGRVVPYGSVLVAASGEQGLKVVRNAVSTVGSDAGNISQSTAAVKVFPNPSSESVRVRWAPLSGESSVRVTLFDLAGRIVLDQVIEIEGENIELPIENLPAGTYYISLRSGAVRSGTVVIVE